MEQVLLKADLERDQVLTGGLLPSQTYASSVASSRISVEAGSEFSFRSVLPDIWSLLNTE